MSVKQEPTPHEYQTMLTTTLAHLKAVLRDGDLSYVSGIAHDIFYKCKGCYAVYRLDRDAELCTNPDCPRYLARQWIKELEAEDAA